VRRQQRRRHEVALPELGEDALDWLQTDDGKNELEANQAREILDLAMRGLSPAERVVITLQELEGRSVKEISALTGSSSVAVRVRAMRARAKLKKALEQLKQTYE
jgi:RNA polymerase sigma-70 factor (ECF subfamily)